MARLVLSDASPLIGLSRIGGVDWLRRLFGVVTIPRAVRIELQAGAADDPRLEAALKAQWLITPSREAETPDLPEHLGEGEKACIRLGLASPEPALLLMDGRLARREAVARGLRVAGTAAVVGLAERRGIIPSARDAFETLLRSDFRIAPAVIRAVLTELDKH